MLVAILLVTDFNIHCETPIDFDEDDWWGNFSYEVINDDTTFEFTVPEYPDPTFIWCPGNKITKKWQGVYVISLTHKDSPDIKIVEIPDSVYVEYKDQPTMQDIEDMPQPNKLYPVLGTGDFYRFVHGNEVSYRWTATYIETIKFPKTVTNLSLELFSYLPSLQRIIIDKENPIYDDHDGILYKYDKSSGSRFKKLLYCPRSWNKTTTFVIPEGTEIIGINAFYKNCMLESVTLPESVIEGNNSFCDCVNLKEIIFNCKTKILPVGGSNNHNLRRIILSDSFETIPANTFSGDNFNVVKIEKTTNLRKIKNEAFSNCRVMFLDLPNIDSIGNMALGRCRAIKLGDNPKLTISEGWLQAPGGYLAINIQSSTPPTVTQLTSNDWAANYEYDSKYVFGGTLYVPKSAIETYRNHPYWGKFASIRRIVDKLIPLVSEVSVSIKTGQTHEYLWDVMPIGNAKSERAAHGRSGILPSLQLTIGDT